jgi:hypothetical protein
VYEDFSLAHIAPEMTPHGNQPVWLVVNAMPNFTTAMLVQYINGALRVFGDWVKDGTPDDALQRVIPEAIQIANGASIKYFAPGEQFDQFNNFGLSRAFNRRKVTASAGPLADRCLGSLAHLLRTRLSAQSAFLVANNAKWTMNALAGGYAYSLDRAGVLSQHPEPGYYATMLRGLESFARWLTVGAPHGTESENAINYETTADGRRYISARPNQRRAS